MPSFFHGIDLATRALRGFQRAMDVTGHNISNVNTRGYSRQTVEFSTTDPLNYYQMGWRSLGNGAQMDAVTRVRDGFLDQRMWDAQGGDGKNRTMADGLGSILGTFNEPNDGSISKEMGNFFNSWSALASNPNESAYRTQTRLAGQRLATSIRTAHRDLSSQQENVTAEINSTVQRINELGQNLASLNRSIREASVAGTEPSDLLDQRDNMIEELSNLTNVTVSRQQDGTTSVFISNFTLVDGIGSHNMANNVDLTAGTVGGTQIRTGKLAGLLGNGSALDKQLTNLDTLANTLRTEINNLHKSGINQNATTNINFFGDVTTGPQTGAIDFDISAEVQADVRNIAIGVTGKDGDTGLALQMSQLRSLKLAGLGNRSVLDYHKDNISNIGSEHAYFLNAAETNAAIMDQVTQQRESVSGVSLDDEMANMLKYQRSYQAAARLISVYDEVAQDLINLIR
ncbi:MAG: flagellar hook-associated protein FlgK [Chthonomonas sp.]|nr:flagellar hook-associated protein FlgK [Chthonomonas sp.]